MLPVTSWSPETKNLASYDIIPVSTDFFPIIAAAVLSTSYLEKDDGSVAITHIYSDLTKRELLYSTDKSITTTITDPDGTIESIRSEMNGLLVVTTKQLDKTNMTITYNLDGSYSTDRTEMGQTVGTVEKYNVLTDIQGAYVTVKTANDGS